jgi:hypothetical protein
MREGKERGVLVALLPDYVAGTAARSGAPTVEETPHGEESTEHRDPGDNDDLRNECIGRPQRLSPAERLIAPGGGGCRSPAYSPQAHHAADSWGRWRV